MEIGRPGGNAGPTMLEDPLTLAFIVIVFAVMVVPMIWLTVVGLRDERHSDEVEPELAADPAAEGISATDAGAEGAEAGAGAGEEEDLPDAEPGGDGTTDEEPTDEAATDAKPGDDGSTDEEPADEAATDAEPGDDGSTDEEPTDEATTDAEPGEESDSEAVEGDDAEDVEASTD